MNTINNQSGMVRLTMDSQALYSSSNIKKINSEVQTTLQPITPTGAQVAQNIEESIADIKADTQQLQKMSEMVTGRKLQFNVNKELNSVIVTVIDSNTNQVLKEIPSKDIQNLKLRIRKAIGNLFDEVV